MSPAQLRCISVCLSFQLLFAAFPLPAQEKKSNSAASAQAECKSSLWEVPASKETPEQAWEADTANLVGYRSKGTGQLETQYVTGDILRLSADEFPSASRSVAASQEKVRTLTFDAREIIIDMPLNFTSANIRFLAETLRFTKRGSITFTAEPRDGGDGVTILAATIDARSALHHPFQFVTQDGNWTPSSKRVVSITARTIKPAQPGVSAKKWAQSLTLDEEYAEIAKGTDLYQNYTVVSDPTAQTTYLKSLDAEMLWPQQLADKIAREFAESPFDESRNEFLRGKAATYLRLLQNTHHDVARAELSSTMTSIDLHVDELGFHRYYIPRTGFPDYQKSFHELAGKQLSSMAAWDSAILAAHSGRKFDKERFDDLDSRLQRANEDIRSASDTVTSELGNLSQHEQDVSVLLKKIEQQRILIQQHRDDDAEKAGTEAKIGQLTTVLVMASAFLPVSAPVAIGIGAAVSATGKAVRAHNKGETVTGLSVVRTLPAAIEEAKSFNVLVTSVRNDWNSVRDGVKDLKAKQDDISKAVGDEAKGKATTARNDAAEKAADAAGKFGRSISTLYEKVQPPEPTQLSLDKYEKEDTGLQDLLKQVGDVRNKEAETLARLDVARKDVILKTGRRDELRTDTEAARASSLQNDREISRLEELAWTIRQTFLRDIAYNAAVLLRAYKYHTSLDPEGPINASYFSRYYRLSRPNQFSKESREGDQFFYGGTEAELSAQLKSQDTQLGNEVGALETQVEEGYNKYFNLIAQHNFLTEDKQLTCAKNTASTKDKRCAFLEAVNKEVERQIIRVASGETNIPPTAIPIPISIQEAYTGLPEKLLDASIQVTVKDPDALSGKSIQYSLVHPFIGALHVGQGCFTVDMRRADAIENVQRFTSSCNASSECTHTPVMLKEEYVRENAALAALPLDATYYLEIRVRDAVNSDAIPQISSITVHLSYVQ